MRPVAPGLHQLDRLRISNAYLLEGPGGDRWLVDCAHRLERWRLLAELRRSGLRPSDLAGVLLTHRHSDHAGNARFLQERFGIPIAAHRADAEILAGRQSRPRLHRRAGTRIAGAFAVLENRWPARHLEVDHALEDGDTVGGLEVHWMPGHTPGSVFYRHAPTRALLSGDTIVTAIPPLTVREGLSLPYSSFTDDMEQALTSLAGFHARRVAYEHLLPGHGRPLIGGARGTVLAFLQEKQVCPASGKEGP
jgi:glyoxylase-like metal-dependent hydrolase (beta-lactamase superfamily II)